MKILLLRDKFSTLQIQEAASKIVACLDDDTVVQEIDWEDPQLSSVLENNFYNYIIAAATSEVRDKLGRIAGQIDAVMLTNIIEILDAYTFVRPIYAGNALETIQVDKNLKITKILTLRQTKSISSAEPSQDLLRAAIVVSGGRGLQSAENFALITQLALRLGAAVGASRAAVDADFISNEHQVGQTGKIIAPKLYIAVGISGAIQHIAGIRAAKTIIAINKDPQAAIFDVADYGLVGDLFSVLPRLIEYFSKE